MALGEGIGDAARALPFANVNQTSFLFGAVFFAFLFFVTVRGDLGKWLGLLGLAGGGATTPNAGASLPAAPSLPGLPGLPQIGAAGNLT
jgi:hypothetical protein